MPSITVSDGKVETTAAAAAIVAFFTHLVFTAALVKIFADSELTVEDILATHASCADPVTFIRALMDVVPGLSRVIALRISNFLAAKPAASSAVMAAGLAAFGTEVHTAVASGAGVATVAATASAAFARYEDDSGKSDVLRDLFMFGPEMLSWGKLEASVASRIRSSKLATGGEWKQHLASYQDFQAFIADCTKHLLDSGHPGHVTRLQQWFSKIPPWQRGGKQYVMRYMRKHHAYLPTRVDMELIQESVSAAMVEMDSHLQSLDVMVESAREIQALRQQVSALALGHQGSGTGASGHTAGNTEHASASNAATGQRPLPRCHKCWLLGHYANECKMPKKDQKDSRDKQAEKQERLEAEARTRATPPANATIDPTASTEDK